MFDYDWFHGSAYTQQKQEARERVAARLFADRDREALGRDENFTRLVSELECRTLIYLRDGFSYELKDLATDLQSKVHLTFETEPVEPPYKAGAFVVAVPFEEICRVEVYAVHPDEKPENKPTITGFRNSPREEIRD